MSGDIGVELFALLSAMGLNKSLQKDGNVLHFYKKRLSRIVPAYLIIVVPFALFLHFMYGASWGHVISLSTSFSTFFGDIAFWFVTYILICYLISPLIFKVKQIIGIPFLLTIISIPFSIALFLALKDHIDNCAVWILRFPVFFLGFDISDYDMDWDKNGRFNSDVSKASLSIVVLIMVFLILVLLRKNSYLVRYTVYLFLTIPLGASIGTLMEICGHFSKPFVFLGAITLELYLLHERICLPIVRHSISNAWAAAVLSIILAIVAAKAVSLIVSNIRKIKISVFCKKQSLDKENLH